MDTSKVTEQNTNIENIETPTDETMQTEDSKPKKKLSKKAIIIIAAAAVLICAIAAVTFIVIIPTVKYNNAAEMLENDLYEDAKLVFTDLGDFKDSPVMIDECGYQEATDLLAAGEYDAAHDKFETMGDYKDSKTMVDESTYQKAVHTLENNLFDDAIAIFEGLGEYSDSAVMITECDYQRGHYLLENDEYFDARKMFIALDDYKDSKEMMDEVMYVKGNDTMETGDYRTAVNSFRGLKAKEYKDSVDLLIKAYYGLGKQMHEEADYYEAFQAFDKIPDYSDVAELLELLKADTYDAAIDVYNEGKLFNDAKNLFNLVEDYEHSQRYLTLILAVQCEDPVVVYRTEKERSGADIYAELAAMIDFANTPEVIMNDTWIDYFLEGHWTSGKYDIELEQTRGHIEENKELIYRYITFSDNLERSGRGKYFKIEDGTLLIGDDENGWTKQYQITYINYNTIEVYSYVTKKTMTFKRD